MPAKLDLYKMHAAEYAATRVPAVVEIKPAKYLGIEGEGAPGSAAFQEAIAALYAVTFTVKMARKFAGRDYAVCKLEGQWWTRHADPDVLAVPPEALSWKLLIRTPEFIGAGEVSKAAEVLIGRGKPEAVKRVELLTLREGRCVQMLHVGPYDQETETVRQMQAFAQKHGLRFHGLHHEIYLSDPRRVAAAKLRTILRLPVKKA